MEMGRSAAPSGMQATTGTPVMISHMPLLSSCKRFPVWKRFRMMPCKGMFWLFKYAAVKPTWFSVPSPASATKRQERCWDITKSAREKAAVHHSRPCRAVPGGGAAGRAVPRRCCGCSAPGQPAGRAPPDPGG